MFSSTPASCAIAGRCSMEFVEQPSAISTVRAFKNASFVMMSRGLISLRTSSIICIPACFASWIRAEYTAGIVPLPEGTEMVMPGDNVTITVELIYPVALNVGLRFAIREGGRTVGAGQITELLD